MRYLVLSQLMRSLALGVFLSLGFGFSSSHANPGTRELETDKRDKLDVVLVLDASGSMLDTDPLKLRYEGAKLFLRFLTTEDRIAIVSFAEEAKLMRGLVNYDPSKVEDVSKEIDSIQAVGRYTDLLAGVEAAYGILHTDGRSDAKPAILLLSDGKMEPDPAKGLALDRTNEMISKVIPQLKTDGIRLYTMALSDRADKALLGEMASSADGITWYTPDAEKIHESFADLFLAVKKPQVVPLTSKGFRIEEDVDEATFYINKTEGIPINLVHPQGDKITEETNDPGVKWFKGTSFDVVTLTKPDPGDWKIEGVEANDGFATVLTNLKLISDWNTNIRAEEPSLIQARLYEGDKPVSLPEMSGVAQLVFQVIPTDKVSAPIIRETLVDDGTHGDKIANDGIFSRSVSIKDAGEYKLTIVAKGPTFQRTQQIPFRVKPYLITLALEEDVEHGEEAHGDDHGQEHDAHDDGHGDEEKKEETESHDEHSEEHVESDDARKTSAKGEFVVALSAEVSSFKKPEIKLVAVDADRKRYILPISRSAKDPLMYLCPTNKLPKAGRFEVHAELEAETKKQEHIHAESKAIEYVIDEGSVAHLEEIQLADHKTVTEEAPSPIIPLILVLLVNSGLGFTMFSKAKKSGSGATKLVLPEIFMKDYKAAFSDFEARARLDTVDFNDPRFSEEDPEEPAPEDSLPSESEASPEGTDPPSEPSGAEE